MLALPPHCAITSLSLPAQAHVAPTRCAAINGHPSHSFCQRPNLGVRSSKPLPLPLFSSCRGHRGWHNSLPLLPFALVPEHRCALELLTDPPHQRLPHRSGCHAIIAPVSSHATAATPPRSAPESSTMSRQCAVSQGTPR
jgi:hypothetical protein